MNHGDELEARRIARLRSVARERGSDETVDVDPFAPGGDTWIWNLALHGGRQFAGGAVCWDPRVSCDNVCRDCPRQAAS